VLKSKAGQRLLDCLLFHLSKERSSKPVENDIPVKSKAKKHVFTDADGNVLQLKPFKKEFRDLISKALGFETTEKARVTVIDEPKLYSTPPVPGDDSPICAKCAMNQMGSENPYIKPFGAENPVVTIIIDCVSRDEDSHGELTAGGVSSFLLKLINEMSKKTGVTEEMIRWVPLTRCAPRNGKFPNLKTKGEHCKNYLVWDLIKHRPKLIIPVGSSSLGAISHKGNAHEWGGHELTYRGWPDDWISNPEFSLPRDNPFKPGTKITGHPVFGPKPDFKIPIIPIQAPKIIWSLHNEIVVDRWKSTLEYALSSAASGLKPKNFERKWYDISTDPVYISGLLKEIAANPGMIVTFDTETTGLKPYADGASIVFMMFRWEDKGVQKSIGFPWDYATSPLKEHIGFLAPFVLEALYKSRLCGHNLSFDMLFVGANVPGADLNKLAEASKWDTWHMAYISRQQKGSLGLEVLAANLVPELSGYEEEMTLLIELMADELDPAAGKGGHYANCPIELWPTHLRPYVMGDVEVAAQARKKLIDKLERSQTYEIPLAHTKQRGRYRRFGPPRRDWLYEQVVSPASRVLQKMMARGMFVDVQELSSQEDLFPKKIKELTAEMKNTHPAVAAWCEQQKHTVPDEDGIPWELDLEKKDHLKMVLFNLMDLPIKRLTDSGKEKYGEKPEDWQDLDRETIVEYAATDKYTLNTLSVDHPQVRPLQEYRRIHKLYSSYVRPMRNFFSDRLKGGVDKKERAKDRHLGRDGCVHASFIIPGTRSGRISSADPNLQQIPREGLIKRMYVSRFGKEGCVYQGDLSQIELRVTAAACGDASMVDAYWKDIDLHSLTHSKIYNRPYEECISEYTEWLQANGKDSEAKKLKEQRKVSKTSNFLTAYGGGAYGLQTSLASQGIYKSIEECEEILEAFFDAYPTLRKYLSIYKNFIMENGVAVSIFGRVRIFEEVRGKDDEAVNKALRSGCNHLIQATASDMMLICLSVIEVLMRDANLESMLVSTVHDSMIIDAKRNELPQVHEIVSEVLGNIPDVLSLALGTRQQPYDNSWCIVPFGFDAEVGENMLEAVKIPKNPDWEKLLARKTG
jgi:DNA polymerase-1